MDCCYPESVKPVVSVRYPDIPSWVDSRTLAVISSYSGNTVETLEMRRQARERGCTIVSITSGGLLMDCSEDAGEFLVRLPVGMQPRHAIGYMIGYTFAIVRAAGGPDFSGRIAGFIDDLREFRDANVLRDGCLARRLAEAFLGRTPVVCSDAGMRSVAFRWKTQLNENSKYVAFCDSDPRFGHGNLHAWTHGSAGDCVLVMLHDRSVGSAMDGETEALMKSGSDVLLVELEGSSTLENMFRAVILGDYISMYMAQARGIDPAEVRPVMQMKAKLGEALRERP